MASRSRLCRILVLDAASNKNETEYGPIGVAVACYAILRHRCPSGA